MKKIFEILFRPIQIIAAVYRKINHSMSKRTKIVVRSVSVLLIIALLTEFLFLPLAQRGLFPKDITLDFTNYNIRMGDSHKVYATGTYNDGSQVIITSLKCKTSSAGVFEVVDKNIVRGVKEGTADLTVSYWGREAKAKVTVHKVENAFAPSGTYINNEFERLNKLTQKDKLPMLTGISNGEKIFLSWNKVTGAAKYVLYRSNDNIKFDKIGESVQPNGFQDVQVINGANYYKLSALDAKGKEISFRTTAVNHQTLNKLMVDGDNDGDGLSNRDELFYGTDINKKDTDNDGVSDKDAVAKNRSGVPTKLSNSSTVPNNTDNDSTKAIEIKEISNKATKISSTKTFASADSSIQAQITGDLGIKDAALTVNSLSSTYFNTLPGLVGTPKEIKLDKEGMKQARITLSYSEQELNGRNPDQLKLYYLDEKNKKAVPVKNIKIDKAKKTVSGDVEHFSIYTIGDEKILGQYSVDGSMNKTDVVFAIDTSAKAVKNGSVKAAKLLYEQFVSNLDSLNTSLTDDQKTRVGLITYSTVPKVMVEPTFNSQTLKEALNKINDTEGGTGIFNALMASKNIMNDSSRKRIIMITTDGKDSSGASGSALEKIAELYASPTSGTGIIINPIAIGGDADIEALGKVAAKTKGISFVLNNGKSVAEVQVGEIYNQFVKQAYFNKFSSPSSATLKLIFEEKYKGIDFDEALLMYSQTNTNLLTGNYIQNVTDMRQDLNSMALVMERSYNSNDSDKITLLGNGWRTNYDSRVVSYGKYGIAQWGHK